jgi:hypothetical protein
MKTTVELPDDYFGKRKRKPLADRLRKGAGANAGPKPWEEAFGGLRQLHSETKRLERMIAAEFETIDADEWR